MKKTLALLLAVVMVLAVLAGCGPQGTTEPTGSGTEGTNPPEGTQGTQAPAEKPVYIYKDAVSQMPTNWNMFTYKTSDDALPIDYGIVDGLYTMMYNDELHPLDGKDPYEGFVFVPAMAADFPVDVTEQVKAEHPEFGIPEDATEDYAFSVKLRDDLTWDDGTPITAQTFLDSYELLLRPELLNYRASDAYSGSFVIANSKAYALSGQPVFQSFNDMGTTYEEFIAAGHTDDEVYLAMRSFWSVTAADGRDQAPITDDTMVRDPAVAEGEDEDYVSAKYLWDNYIGPEGYYGSQDPTGYTNKYAGTTYMPYEEGYSFDNVGLFISGENELTFVYEQPIGTEFNLLTNIGVNLVKPDLYESLLVENETASGSMWSTTYCTNASTSPSYGPYKVSDYQLDKSMHFVKNENWYGWNYDAYKYVDPEDGQTYDPYMTDEIDVQYVKEAATRKEMFLAGQLMAYGLGAEDFDQYRSSEYTLATPGQASFMLLMNGYESAINQRENAGDFDKTTTDLQTMLVPAFREAIGVSIDRDLMAATISPARTGAYGMLGTLYVVDPETGTLYRDTDQAKMALINYYKVDLDKFNGDLDAAVDSITGYDPETAKELYTQAFQDSMEAGYITDEDGDGKSDQTVTITYAISQDNDFMTKTIDFLNESLAKATEGTPFEGKVVIVKSAPVGNAWSDRIEDGTYDTQLAGWNGNTYDPYNFALVWTDGPGEVYWGNWFTGEDAMETWTIDGQEITMSLRQWAQALNGQVITLTDPETGEETGTYNFGDGQTSIDNRVQILANIEQAMLESGNCYPVLLDGGMSLYTQQGFWVVDEYDPFMGRGGIRYYKYNYSESEWADYVASQGGVLQY